MIDLLLGTCICLFVLCMAVLGLARYQTWRELRDRRIRTTRFSLGPFRGTRDRFLS